MSEEKQEAPEVQEENIVKVSLKKEDLETVNKVDLSQKAESLEPEGTSEEAALEKQVEEVKPAIASAALFPSPAKVKLNLRKILLSRLLKLASLEPSPKA